jgi:hypothetical protein
VYLDPPAIKEIQASGKPMTQAALDSELEQSVWRDDLETAQALFTAGASPNGETTRRIPLFGVRSAAMLRVLVAAGASLDSLDNGGATALVQATRSSIQVGITAREPSGVSQTATTSPRRCSV